MEVRHVPDIAIIEVEPEKHLVTITFKPINLDLDAAIKFGKVLEQVLNDFKLDRIGIVTDMRDLLHVSRTAREYFAENGDENQVIADAVIITSPILKQLYNISMKFTKPHYPIKSFTSLLEGRRWIEDLLRKEKLM